MLKKTICLAVALLLAAGLCACGLGSIGGIIGGNESSGSGQGGGGNQTGKLTDGKWPSSVYGQYGIDEISTKGKIVYTDFTAEGSYQYEVCYDGVTREELVSWTESLFGKGFRADGADKDRLANSTYDYDVLIYCKEEKQPYRMQIAFDFGEKMSFEYYEYWDNPNPAFTVVEREEDGETEAYIEYNLRVTLNPIKNSEEYEGEFPSLGLKPEDLKGVEGVRKISLGEAAYMSSINFTFYADHVTTEAEAEQCRTLLIDKLSEKGAKFYDGLDQSKELTAAELKESGKGSYYVEKDGNVFLLIVNPDSDVGHFGDSYGLVLTKKS